MPRWNPFSKGSEENNSGDQSKSEADALVERFAAVIDEKIKPIGEKVGALQTEWDAIKQEAVKANEPPPPDPATLTDADKQANREKAIFATAVLSNARITEMEAVQSLQGQWEHLIPEFKRMAAATPVEVKANPNYAKLCNDAIDQLIGKAARAAGVRSDSSGKFFIEDSASKTGGEDSPLNEIQTWQSDDRVETVSETLAKLKVDPKKFSEDLKAGRLH